MRHRVRGRKLGRNASHRKAMFRNMACSLIRTVRVDEDDPQRPRVPGRIVTTVAKAKELRPFVEKLITIAKRAIPHETAAAEFATSAEKNSDDWRTWRQSKEWQQWSQAIAPAVALRRRAFALLRDQEAVDVLFDELAEQFEDRDGGYTRIVRLAAVRLGDSGQQALIEFVGERDRVKSKRRSGPVVVEDNDAAADEDAGADEDSSADEASESDAPAAENDAAESSDEADKPSAEN